MIKQPKPKTCAWSKCGKMFNPNPFRFNQRTCDNIMCAMGHVKEKAEKKEAQDWHKEKKVMKENLKTLGDYEKEARKVFQQFIRLRDKDQPCISCGCVTAKQWDAGHYLKAELFTALIFTEENVHKQCSRCNDLFSGNELEYRDGLIKRYGADYVAVLEAKKNAARVYKFTREELVRIKLKYKAKIKELL